MIRDLYYKYREIVKYLIVGVLTTVVSLLVYYVCVFTLFNPENAFQLQMANVVSWIAAVMFAYITNRRFVFESKNNNIIKEATSFCGSRVVTLIIDMLCMLGMVTILGISDKFAKLIVQVIITVGNYILSKFLVFKRK